VIYVNLRFNLNAYTSLKAKSMIYACLHRYYRLNCYGDIFSHQNVVEILSATKDYVIHSKVSSFQV